MKWLAIVNPISGGKRTQAALRQLLSELRSVVDDCELTQHSGHAEQLAAAASSFDGIAVVGGDGTLFEVLRGMDLPRQHLSLIPTGTGNSLARDLALTSSAQGLEALRTHRSLCIDLMRTTFTTTDGLTHQCYAATTIGLGYPANVARAGNQRFKRFGRWCYPLAATVETFSSKPFSMQIGYHGDHAEWKDITGLMINNTQHAGNFRAFPQARLDDGVFNVMEMKAGWLGQNVHNASVLLQLHLYAPSNLTNTSSVHITLKSPHDLMIDGEIFPYVTRIDIQIAPQTLTCYYNRRSHL